MICFNRSTVVQAEGDFFGPTFDRLVHPGARLDRASGLGLLAVELRGGLVWRAGNASDMMLKPKIRVLLVDDHPFILEGLRAVLATCQDIEVVAQAASGEEAVAIYGALQPSIVVMDISMPKMSGIDAAVAIRERWPDAKVLILTIHAKKAYSSQAIACGARGYITKDAPTADLVRAIKQIHGGDVFFPDWVTEGFVSDFVANEAASTGRASHLSNREREILKLIASGLTNKEAASRLQISVRTVEKHRERAMEKLNLHSVVELTKFAIAEGLVQLNDS